MGDGWIGARGLPRHHCHAMRIVHVELSQANNFVTNLHRHHKPVVGHRFSIGCQVDDALVGVAIVGRPVARHFNTQTTVEVTRLCTDGTPNACSFLYQACARAAKALGYEIIQTYILQTETGVSLKACGWRFEQETAGGLWVHSDGKPRRTHQPTMPKQRWARTLI